MGGGSDRSAPKPRRNLNFMLRLIAIDTGPLGLLTHPHDSPESRACQEWLAGLSEQGVRLYLPEIADYELRREYLRTQNGRSLEKLQALGERIDFLPISSSAMRRAAGLWAQMRQTGRPTAHSKALDGDCILMAQITIEAERFGLQRDEWIIATTDVGDLPTHVPAAKWQDITL